MNYSCAQKKRKVSERSAREPFIGGQKGSSFPNSALLADPGHQVDMPVVMREKMEGAFGMDLSGVKLYENKAVGKAGAEAVTQGSRIAFAPGRLDFSSTHGQALLGHEISHVASQARGEVKGSGLVNDHALEARADREGLMAARGESVTSGYGGASAALSNASAASAAGPMQAKSGKRNQPIIEEAQEEPQRNLNGDVPLIYDPDQDPKNVKQRGFLGTALDWFRTVGAHWFPQSKELKSIHKQKDAYEKEQLFSNKEAIEDAELDNFVNEQDDVKKAKKKKIKLIGDDEEDNISVYD